MQSSKKVFLSLVRLGVGHSVSDLPETIDWPSIQDSAVQHGLYAVVLDGVECLRQMKPDVIGTDFQDKIMLAQWIGEVHQNYELRYESYKQTIKELAAFYKGYGFKMMVLKGYACSLDWPKPEHRPCGDIDIWLFGRQKEADQSLVQKKGIDIDSNHHHHTVFCWNGYMVENHYDFINTHAHRSSRRFEARLKDLAYRYYREVEIFGAKVYLPGADFNFLFLLRHMANHFVGKEMTLRQLLDWALFIEHHHEEIDWKDDLAFLEENGLLRYFNLMALISVERLGFSRDIFHCELKEDELKERVFNDIIEPEYNTPMGKGALRIMIGKTRRWWSNRWKHRLCYSDSLLSGFVYGVKAKIQKPAHFLH